MLLWPSDSHASGRAIVARDSDGTSDRSPTSRRWDTRQADAVGSDREPDCAITGLRIDADRLQSARDGGFAVNRPGCVLRAGPAGLGGEGGAEPGPADGDLAHSRGQRQHTSTGRHPYPARPPDPAHHSPRYFRRPARVSGWTPTGLTAVPDRHATNLPGTATHSRMFCTPPLSNAYL